MKPAKRSRMLQKALDDVGSDSPRPGSASHIVYGGSRRRSQRFEYSIGSASAFVELSPAHTPTPLEFFHQLQAVPGVEKVEWQTTKASQGNIGDHYCEQNILVYSTLGGPGSASSPLEFELTRNNHMKNKEVPFTLTVMFKDPPQGMIPEAWRILRKVTAEKELFSEMVDKSASARAAEPGSASAAESAGAPSSAGAAADCLDVLD